MVNRWWRVQATLQVERLDEDVACPSMYIEFSLFRQSFTEAVEAAQIHLQRLNSLNLDVTSIMLNEEEED